MKTIHTDLAVIGGGPAGLAAALEAKRKGVNNVLLLERDIQLGGILPQCIHDGFGIHRFQQRMAGSQYAQRFIDELADTDVTVKLDTMVLEITPEKTLYACNKTDGMLQIECGAIVLAMGCRERTGAQVLLHGFRPAGVLTAGSVQRYINIEGYLPGKNAVILGSGDIGLIMARRLTLEGAQVQGVYEVMPTPGGLTRNIVQCLDDYDIPLHLSTTVTCIHGKDRVNAVTVASVDENRKPVPGTEQTIPCDLLVLAVGLIPENELSLKAGIVLDPVTKGPVLDNRFMTSVPGIFAAGNVAVVFDLVDYVSLSGEIAGRGATDYLAGRLDASLSCHAALPGENVQFVIPQRLRAAGGEKTTFFMRVRTPRAKAQLDVAAGGETYLSQRHSFVAPPEMIACEMEIPPGGDITFDMADV